MNFKDEVNVTALAIRLYNYLKRYILLYLAAIIIGVSSGLISHYLETPIYNTYFVANSTLISNYRMVYLIKHIQKLIETTNLSALSAALGISEEDAKSLKYIEAIVLDEEKRVSREELVWPEFEINCFQVNLTVDDPGNMAILTDGIIGYINKNEYLTKSRSTRDKSLRKILGSLDRQIGLQDSLQAAMVKKLQEKSGTVNYVDGYPRGEANSITRLFTERQRIEELLTFNTPINIIKPVTIHDQPSQRWSFPVMVYTFVFFVLAIFVTLFAEIKKKVKETQESMA